MLNYKILKINKGNLDIGNDADFCIVDINRPWIVKKDNLISKSKNTSIDDKKLQGKFGIKNSLFDKFSLLKSSGILSLNLPKDDKPIVFPASNT